MTRVAVVGPGAIGATFAAAVQEAGGADDELVLCGRRPRPAPVVIRPGAEPIALRGPVLADPAQAPGVAGWVLLAVKAHQTDGAAGWLRALCGPATRVLVLQNGVEQVERVTPHAGEATVLPAVVWAPAEETEPGLVHLRGRARLIVPIGPDATELQGLLANDWSPVETSADITTELWRKLVINAIAGLSVLAGRRSGMFARDDVAALARAYALECLAVARAEGARLDDGVADETLSDLNGLPPDLGTSMLFDREAGRTLEWDARNEVVRRRARRHDLPTPIGDVVVPLLAAASDGVGGFGK